VGCDAPVLAPEYGRRSPPPISLRAKCYGRNAFDMIRTRYCHRLFAAVWIWAVAVPCWLAGPALAYVPDDPWTLTASGATSGEGNPITLTWGFADDGTYIPSEGASNLIAYLDDIFNVSSGGSDLTQRSWFRLFEDSFDRWSQLGGITFVYEAADDGTQLATNSGTPGVRGDVRIGGAYVDGASGTLAYTWLPDNGDMVIDTGETTFYSNSTNDYLQLRNTVTHELGHAFGLLHVESSSDALLLEPYISTSFDGPQLDDIRGIQGLYGDALEKSHNGQGNDSYSLATNLGLLASGGSMAIGTDAVGGQAVDPSETDFVSIANSSDVDFFSFTLNTPAELDLTLTPLGGIFYQGVEGGSQTLFDANARNDLSLAVYDHDGATVLASANSTGAGQNESIADLFLAEAGQYFVRITGAADAVQLYQLEMSALGMVMLPGDYNGDETVDAADYTVWRDSLGDSVSPYSGADGSGNGLIDEDDFDVWRAGFGTTLGSGAGVSITLVPEPMAGHLLLFGMLAVLYCRRVAA
jgi:serralysin